jgi:arsenite methyltransferase
MDQLQEQPFSTIEMESIRGGIHDKYKKVASSANGLFKYPVGKEGATALGYDEQLLASLPDEALASFCGVGNPFAVKSIAKGSQVLDLGCGAGIDMIMALEITGPDGKVTGVDLTEEMVNRAKKNLSLYGAENAEIHKVDSEQLPFADEQFDVVISNGVINLSPAKRYLFRELYRVLKSGGHLQFADIILAKELPPHLASGVESWSQ